MSSRKIRKVKRRLKKAVKFLLVIFLLVLGLGIGGYSLGYFDFFIDKKAVEKPKKPEVVEVKDHPWFIAVQFHPELKSKPFAPHPLFISFIAAAIEQSRLI